MNNVVGGDISTDTNAVTVPHDYYKKGGRRDDHHQLEQERWCLLRRYKSYYDVAKLAASCDDKQPLAAELTIERRDDEVLSLLVEIVVTFSRGGGGEKVHKVFPDPSAVD